MKLCRFDDNRIGVVRGRSVHDVTAVLGKLPAVRWPLPPGDLLISALPELRDDLERAAGAAACVDVDAVRLLSPVANPTKIIGAPINYDDHVEESRRDQTIAYGRKLNHIGEFGLFLKANTSLVGAGEGVALRFPDRRNDHEMELAVVIGRKGTSIELEKALDYVAGYAIGLDMTLRGPEVPSFRKSIDTYAVIGPWLTTADEILDPNRLDLQLSVNGEERQRSNTKHLVYNVQRLISWASEYYTLYPGDLLLTGTPQGVGPVKPQDVISCGIERVGQMTVAVRAAADGRTSEKS
jgi:2-keto-4-pentenoate hydratase/2-oxohepta-3-ene-1,7-dioic acid hydratase in catechol pathway